MKLALGTAQFGLDYGIANREGKVPDEELSSILALARESGVDTLDTAIAYGDAEERLGRAGVAGFRVVSKLPAVPPGTADPRAWVRDSVRASLTRLGIDSLAGLLLHRPDELSGANGGGLQEGLRDVVELGWASRIGVSIYAPEAIADLPAGFTPGLVQVPFNLFDQRILEGGWLDRLQGIGAEVHVRSAFLQGLLLLPAASRPPWVERWSDLFAAYDGWLAETGRTPLEGCIGAALSVRGVDRIVVGVDRGSQLAEVIRAASSPPVRLPEALAARDIDLLNPARWPA